MGTIECAARTMGARGGWGREEMKFKFINCDLIGGFDDSHAIVIKSFNEFADVWRCA